jgi:hypothetical protein
VDRDFLFASMCNERKVGVDSLRVVAKNMH